MNFSVGLLKCKSFITFFLNNDLLRSCQMMVWNLLPCSPTTVASVDGLPTVQRWSEDAPFVCLAVPSVLPGPVLAITCELCYVSQCCCCCCCSFFFLIRWISKIVAVQKLVVFFKKKTNSFSNILWNCFIHSFIFKPNVSRVLLPSI